MSLSIAGVDVWRVQLRQSAVLVRQLLRTLSPDEISRAANFCIERDRVRFIVARGVLRSILGRCLGIEPDQLAFHYGPQGKPYLSDVAARSSIRFNLSHSDDVAVYGITQGRDIGIDVERVRHDFPGDEIAVRFFSPRERALLCSLPPRMSAETFFRFWTCKEAYVKARGGGLSISFNHFDVSDILNRSNGTLKGRSGREPDSIWSLMEFDPGPGYVAAVALEGYPCRLTCRRWSESQMQQRVKTKESLDPERSRTVGGISPEALGCPSTITAEQPSLRYYQTS